MADENKNNEGGGETPPEKQKSKDIVVSDEKRYRELEKRVSELQDLRSQDKGIIDNLTKWVEGAKAAPSTRLPGKSLLDEVSEFLGFGEETTSTTPPTNDNPK